MDFEHQIYLICFFHLVQCYFPFTLIMCHMKHAKHFLNFLVSSRNMCLAKPFLPSPYGILIPSHLFKKLIDLFNFLLNLSFLVNFNPTLYETLFLLFFPASMQYYFTFTSLNHVLWIQYRWFPMEQRIFLEKNA